MQYTVEEVYRKENWGHSSFCYAIDFAVYWNIKKVYLFHHEPVYEKKPLERELGLPDWAPSMKKRNREFSQPRQIAMYICREMTDLSLPKIGASFGGRDHTTVLHACEKISKQIKLDPTLAEDIKNLKEDIQ